MKGLLFEVGERGEYKACPVCRVRLLQQGFITCDRCGGRKVKLCSICKVRPAIKSISGKWRRKTCDECYVGPSSDFNSYPDGIPELWRYKIGSVVSGLRQRAKFRGEGKAAKESELAEKIKEQGFCCGVTGVDLLPDRTTQLGHIVPGSRGGSHSIENLLWMRRDVNRMMSTMTLQEFRKLCESVSDMG